MRSRTPTVHCDGKAGECGAWDLDYYEATVSSVNGVAITRSAPAPGWHHIAGEDLCPRCAFKAAQKVSVAAPNVRTGQTAVRVLLDGKEFRAEISGPATGDEQ